MSDRDDLGRVGAMRLLPFQDGDIQLQPKTDMLGRFSAAGRHTNYGYTGYFKPYVFVRGKVKRTPAEVLKQHEINLGLSLRVL